MRCPTYCPLHELITPITGGCCCPPHVQNLTHTGAGSPGRTSRRGVGATSVPSMAPRAKYAGCGGGGGGGRVVANARFSRAGGRCREEKEEEDDDDDDAVPRKPLRVVPVESSTPVKGSRSECWRASQTGREKSEAGKNPGGPWGASSYLPPSSCQVVVWIDALYALESHRESFHGKMLGDALYLVLEDRSTQHRTATRRRGRLPRTKEGQACRADGRDGGVDAWIFRETVALNVAAAGGRGGGGGQQGREVMRPEDDDDRVLPLRVCVAPSPGSSSSSPPRRRAPVLQGMDAAAPADGEVATDEVIGSATIPLERYLGTADKDGRTNCTFLRPIRVPVVNPEGLAIGWIELGLCGSVV